MKNLFILVSFAALLFSCTKEKDNSNTEKITIGTLKATNLQYDVKLLADVNTFEVGYQNVYFQISKNNENIKAEHVHFYPWMDMGMHQHGAPAEDLVWENNLYKGAAVFSMATSAMGTWELVFVIHHNNLEDTLRFPVTVNANATGVKKLASVTGDDTKKYMVALVAPQTPKIGVNDLSMAVFENQNGVFSIVENLAITIDPQMISMGHGSPNNVNPVWNASTKHYDGKVNFTMTGDWRLFFNVERNGAPVITQSYLDFNF